MDINYITDAKNEYTKQLQNILIPRLYEGIDSLYNESNENNVETEVLSYFQTSLRDVPKWNQDIIEHETSRIVEVSDCEWLDNLITAVFISNTKILAAVKIKTDDEKIDISVPRLPHFIHRCYIEVAREIYKNPYLYDKSITDIKEKQRNIRDALLIIGECISNAVRSLLPIKTLLNKYLGSINNTNIITRGESNDEYDMVDKQDLEEEDTEELVDDEIVEQEVEHLDEKEVEHLDEKEVEHLVEKEVEHLVEKEVEKEVEHLDEKIVLVPKKKSDKPTNIQYFINRRAKQIQTRQSPEIGDTTLIFDDMPEEEEHKQDGGEQDEEEEHKQDGEDEDDGEEQDDGQDEVDGEELEQDEGGQDDGQEQDDEGHKQFSSSILEPRKRVIHKKLRFSDEDIKNVRIEENIIPKNYKTESQNVIVKEQPSDSVKKQNKFEFF
jgi:hypothetical protein